MLERSLVPSLDRGVCPHLAVLLRREDDLHDVLASFYALGAKRNGWLAHRSVAGEADADRDRLAVAGLDVTGLEREQRLAIVEFDPDEAPESSPEPWRRALADALDRGHTALWYSRFAVGADPAQFERVVEFERAWDQAFADMPVVTLCPYVVADMSGAGSLERLRDVSAFHDGVLVQSPDRELALFQEASRA
jgi:MEDS: MEthanogen/methylotroph, DcmR Sensory domain